ncbi:monovalent cation/H+ antiporter complex subunit F [Dehalococcoidia bacterium]|nr:monovalent cation/H+ antiporter complex subunit F [Dehalococcoidia bacterium]
MWFPIALFLGICIAVIVIRLFLGLTPPPDRLVGLDTLNTLVIVSMVVLGAAFENPIYIDVAIVYGLLSFVATLFIAKYIEKGTF